MRQNRGRPVKGPRGKIQAFIDAIDWWVATKMLMIIFLGIGLLAWVIYSFLWR